MSFGNKLQLNKVVIGTAIAFLATTGLLMAEQAKAASNCTGPTFDAGTRTLSLVCTESTDIHELSCLDAFNPDTLFLSVNGLADTITCPPDVPPNTAPSVVVAGPASGSSGTNYSFTITGTDAEGNALNYGVDWNNDGVADFVSGSMPSGTGVTVAQNWGTSGTYTFGARAIDDQGLASNWVTHIIAITTMPTATVEVQVNGGGWGSVDQTINPGDTVTIRWNSTDATTCTGTNLNTGGATNSAGVVVGEPAPNSSLTYTVECTGPGGTISENVIVTTRQSPNLTEPSVNFSPSGTVDPVTGNYTSVGITFQTGNNGGSDTVNTVTYRVEIDYGNNGSYDVSDTGTITNLAPGGNYNGSETFLNVPFGNNTIRVTIDSNNDVTESDETDNVRTLAMTLSPAAPSLQLSVDKEVVRQGQNVTVSWDTAVSYSLNCSVSGPALTPSPYTFNPSVNGTTGSRTTGALSSKSEYLLSCTEPVTNTTFTETISVEVTPTAEEI